MRLTNRWSGLGMQRDVATTLYDRDARLAIDEPKPGRSAQSRSKKQTYYVIPRSPSAGSGQAARRGISFSTLSEKVLFWGFVVPDVTQTCPEPCPEGTTLMSPGRRVAEGKTLVWCRTAH